MNKGQERWVERAQQIKDGEKQHPWDLLEERGYIKDVTGYDVSPEQTKVVTKYS